MNSNKEHGNFVAGAACFGGIAAGAVALVAAAIHLINGNGLVGAACLAAAALAFGLVANAVLRN